MLKDEPRWNASRTDMDELRRLSPYTDNAEPILPYDRNDIELPMCAKSRTDMLVPIRANPYTDNELPSRTKDRIDNELPKWT
jgi:hypothetical protein